MKRSIVLLVAAVAAFGQPNEHLTEREIAAALAAKPGSGTVWVQDRGFDTPSLCQAQIPSEFLYTPAGWLWSLSFNAKKQFLQYKPTDIDTRRMLTVISYGCANGTPSGPSCQSISRVALLSDPHGGTVVESLESAPLPQSWQNGYGATAACINLVSRFSMTDLAKVRNTKGEFIIATFGGNQLLKMYTIKEKHLKSLGL